MCSVYIVYISLPPPPPHHLTLVTKSTPSPMPSSSTHPDALYATLRVRNLDPVTEPPLSLPTKCTPRVVTTAAVYIPRFNQFGAWP